MDILGHTHDYTLNYPYCYLYLFHWSHVYLLGLGTRSD
jgi:hypothetical protein